MFAALARRSWKLTKRAKLLIPGLLLTLTAGFAATMLIQSKPVTVLDAYVGAVKQVSAGRDHTCAVLADGTARCWGRGENYRIAAGDSDQAVPKVVAGLEKVSAVSAGGRHSCALLADGTAKCWGANDVGQVGNAATGADVQLPATVVSVAGALDIDSGEDHTCAVTGAGKAHCWGKGSDGRLGNNATADASTPVEVSGLTTAVDVASGEAHSCALLSGATVSCWGSNASGQLGDDPAVNASRLTPFALGLSGVIALDAGDDHTCALIDDGTARCWGDNTSGQLGDGTNADSFTPVTVTGLSGAIAITAGSDHSCALLAGGEERCWGAGTAGKLGTGSSANSSTPQVVRAADSTPLAQVVAITAGGRHSCAILASGAAPCWGADDFGQTGNG